MRLFLLVTTLLLPFPALARAPKVIPLPAAEIATKVNGRDVTIRMTDGSKFHGKVKAADSDSLTVKPNGWRKAARTIAWRDVAGVNVGHTRGTKFAAGGLLVGGLGSVGLVAAGASPQRHPLEFVGVGLMGAAILPLVLGRSIEYQPR